MHHPVLSVSPSHKYPLASVHFSNQNKESLYRQKWHYIAPWFAAEGPRGQSMSRPHSVASLVLLWIIHMWRDKMYCTFLCIIYMVAVDSKVSPHPHNQKVMYCNSTRAIKRKIDPKTVDLDWTGKQASKCKILLCLSEDWFNAVSHHDSRAILLTFLTMVFSLWKSRTGENKLFLVSDLRTCGTKRWSIS